MRVLGKAWNTLRTGRGAVFGALALFILFGCMLGGEGTANRGSEVENEIHGVLVAVDGDPVQGAKVKAVPVVAQVAKRAAAAADSDSVVTDEDGKYSLRGLEPGTYNLFGEYGDGDLVVLIPGVDHSDTTERKDQGVDTLRAPGRIRGRLLLGDQGKGGVLAYVPGTSYLAVSDDSGRFVIGGVPQGIHQVSYSTSGYVIAPDTGVAVLSGKTTDLPVRQLAPDPALPPPAPTGLKAVYDTLNERVTLTWKPVPVADLDGYVIYRDAPSFLDPQIVPGGFTRDTVFVDSFPNPPPGTAGREIVYRVRARDLELNQSQVFSTPAQVTAVSREQVTTRADLEVSGLQDARASIGDTLTMIAGFANPTRRILSAVWMLEGETEPVRTREYSARSGTDTLIWPVGEPGAVRFTVRFRDEGGMEWPSTRTFEVLLDPPSASAGADIAASPGDTLRLMGSASDALGRIVKWEWDIAGRGFSAGRADTVFVLPRGETGDAKAILRVTDDDGLTGADTLLIRVSGDEPTVDAGPDRRVSLGDTVVLKASARDRFGRIVAYGWDAGGTGTFRGGDSVAAIASPRKDTVLIVVVRVTDDDGMQAQDTVVVVVVRDEPVAETEFGAGYYVYGNVVRVTSEGSRDSLGAIAKREWDPGALGVFSEAGTQFDVTLPGVPGKYPVVLRVTDDDGLSATDTAYIPVNDTLGWSWAKAADLPLPGEIYGHDVLEFKDKLWILGGSGNPSVLSSPDGKSWTAVAASPFGNGAWLGSAAVYKDQMWMIGGYVVNKRVNTVWRTSDGLSWTRMPDPPFDGLSGHETFVLNGELFVIGGARGEGSPPTYSTDVWRTSDGVYWTRSSVAATLGIRAQLSVAVLGNKAFAVCGVRGGNTGGPGEVWSSEDGVTWSQVTMDPGSVFLDPVGDPVVAASGRLWTTSGSELLVSPDGEMWRAVPVFLKPRSLHGFASFRGTIWIIGGDEMPSDVWYAE